MPLFQHLRRAGHAAVDWSHPLAAGLRAIILPDAVLTPYGVGGYEKTKASGAGIATATSGATSIGPERNVTFVALADISSTSADAVLLGRVRYNGTANYGACLRASTTRLELNGAEGTSAWHSGYSPLSSVLTGRHVYAGTGAQGKNTSTGGVGLWRDGAKLSIAGSDNNAFDLVAWDTKLNVGQSDASGQTAISAALGGSVLVGLYYTQVLRDEQLIEVQSHLLYNNSLPFMRGRRLGFPVSAAPADRMAVESDAALALTGLASQSVGLSSETGTALLLTGEQSASAGLSSEADTALALTGAQSASAGLATETDTALAISGSASGAVGLATETDTALALTTAGAIGAADETDTAFALAGELSAPVGLATETDTALALVSGAAVGMATETDQAFALSGSLAAAFGLALEIDVAFALVGGDAPTVEIHAALTAARLSRTGPSSRRPPALSVGRRNN